MTHKALRLILFETIFQKELISMLYESFMSKQLAEGIVKLKTAFSSTYKRNSHLHEVIPVSSSKLLPINEDDLKKLHEFATNNPIYSNYYEDEISNIRCRVYEGDINNYWLDSIKHDTSYAPFYPTWILSDYALASTVKNLNVKEVVDIGSGDGRIAYCAQVIGIKSYGIEIDENLVTLQKNISSKTNVDFNAQVADATQFDYTKLELSNPAFFIGGLPEIGEILANSVISNVTSIPNLKENSTFVLTGTNSVRNTSRDHSKWGWGLTIDNFSLKVSETITLPTQWTVDQPIDTPYVFTTTV